MPANGDAKYDLHGEYQGAYIFVIEGSVEVNGHKLERRDAIGLWELDHLDFKTSEGADVLVVEIPMR
jgi:redox-sensitive bicupin YhaK (pirin superfamily)